MKAYMFPGQGSQVKGMGGALFDKYSEHTAVADDILGLSIRRLCLENPDGMLKQTQYTQPALYVVNTLMYLDVRATEANPPDYFIGHSLGEYNALQAAGVFDFATGLRLVKRRGELMAQAAGGAMAAVLNLAPESIAPILRDSGLDAIDIANFNSPVQTVIAGPKEVITAAQEAFTGREGVRFIPLNVSAAFHSRYMGPTQRDMASALDRVTLSAPTVPVIANVTARPYRSTELKKTLCDQICSPVQWLGSIRYLMDAGVSELQEVGPGKVLTKLVRAIQRQVTPPATAVTDVTDDRTARPSTGR
ncbi:MAG: ACP S-malonyltransferase, partial [Myxococcota bacterium]